MKFETESLTPGHRAHLEARARRVGALRRTLDADFPGPAAVVLELGCGHGHYLTAYAQQHPEVSCLGVDLVTKRIEKARRKRDKRHLENLQFLKAEARELLEAWPDRLRIERVFVLFPDPWPKKRHAKNRLVQPDLLDRLADHAAPGTPLHFRTDDPQNFAWVMDVIASHARWEICDEAAWPFENPSFFQDLFGEYYSLTALCLGS